MSRKPPKLAPIEGRESTGGGNGRASHSGPPPLRQGASVGQISVAYSTPRRSSLARNFLNCNGSNTGSRKTFPSKLPLVKAVAPSSSVISASEETSPNGCEEEKEPDTPPSVAVTTKVNGTIPNGLASTDAAKGREPPKLVKRSKSTGGYVSESSSGSDNPKGNVTLNGKKTGGVNSRNSVSNSSGSHNNNAGSVAKRTSRLSQSSAVVSRASKCPSNESSSGESSIEDKTMPALVACEPPPVKKEPPPQETKTEEEVEELIMTTDEPISEEPRIIRQGDTVIKSYIDEKTGRISVFERGMKLEVCDFGSGKWYPAKVMNIDWNKQEILVHYSNWSSRYDEWISMKSTRIRPGKNTNVVRVQFEIGERVEAVWPMDSRKYSGTVTHKLPQDSYEVTFDDGIKLKRSANQLFKISSEAEEKPPTLIDTTSTTPPPPPLVKVESTKAVSRSPSKKQKVKPEARMPSTSKLPVTESKVENVSTLPQPPTTTTTTTPPDLAADPSRLHHHFSVFDPPPSDLGKRKRTVHDYSALVKGRQGQRTPQVKGPRRPKSEGCSIASPVASTSTEEAGVHLPEDSAPKASATSDAIEPGSDTKRRQKSGSSTQVPTTPQPLTETPKELPPVEPILVEPLPTPEHNEAPSKKRKLQHSAKSSTSTTTTGETKVSQKSEVALPTDIQNSTTTSTPTTSRRTKSLGTIHLGIHPPVVDPDVPNDTKADSGFVDEKGNAIVIEQNAIDGFWKCPLHNCGKNFRKDSLLKMHFKHYHPELKVANARGIANVVQMAQARTAFDNDPSDYHVWPKHLSVDLSTTFETTPAAPTDSSIDVSEVTDTQVTHKKTPKHPHSKTSSPEKASTVVTQGAEDTTLHTSPTKSGEDASRDGSKTSTRSPRLRMNRKRTFVLTKYGRIRAPSKLVLPKPTPNEGSQEEIATDHAMATDGGKKPKKEETFSDVTCSNLGEECAFVPSPTSSFLSTSNTPSPSVSDQFSTESSSGSISGDPVFAPSNSQLEPQLVSNKRIKDRWSKAHIRRGLMSSGIRRVGSGINSTTLFLKKRMQLRKFMGKRGSRQKRISILSRISSGRMRVILDALNQRSLRRQRFRASRRYRDVKVDVINCVCSSKTEFGLMIQCELCLCWQHGSCFNVQSNSQLPDFYACQSCSEPEKVRLSRKYEWAESEFYRLGKLPSFPFAQNFSKEDSRIMKMCTNLSSNLIEAYSMIKGLTLKERICFAQPEHPQLYEWNTERAAPQEEIQKDRFNKYFKPVLRRLLLENKSDSTYHTKLKKLAEARMKLRKYADAVESARSTLKKKLGCRAAAFLDHICDKVLSDMVRSRRRAAAEDSGGAIRKDNFDIRKRSLAEQAYHRLCRVQDEIRKNSVNRTISSGGLHDKPSSFDDGATSSSSSHTSNGMRREATLNMKDYNFLKKYLREKRTLDTTISLTLTRMSKEFPDDWRNLMKVSRSFIDESRKDAYQDAKLKWITNVIVTYNTLRILLKHIYSEQNSQKQRTFCTDFEKTTIKLFDLFSIGLAEEKLEIKKQHISVNQNNRVRGLETLDMLSQSASPAVVKTNDTPTTKLAEEVEDARKELLKRLGTSTKPLTSKDVDELLTTASETKRIEDEALFGKTNSSSSDLFLRARKVDGHIAFEFNQNVHLLDAVKFAGNIPDEECTEEDLSLEFPDVTVDVEEPTTYTGIIPVPADSRITPDVCKKNLARDILLQQQQIDVYLDKIEGQILKLSSQSKHGEAVTNTKPGELSAQRTRMLQSLDLVSRLCKTVIGDNDVVEPAQSDMDASETTISDYSDMESSSESDGFDNASNYSGTDTETADEGDITGDDDLLDV